MSTTEALKQLRDKGFSAWLGWDEARAKWCVQVKPRTQGIHEQVFGESPDAAAAVAVEHAKRCWPDVFAPPPPPQTAGQRIAEGTVQWDGFIKSICVSHPNLATYLVLDGSDSATADTLRRYIAAAIDKAIADDRAAGRVDLIASIRAEREACAKVADDYKYRPDETCPRLPPNGVAGGIAARIRTRP